MVKRFTALCSVYHLINLTTNTTGYQSGAFYWYLTSHRDQRSQLDIKRLIHSVDIAVTLQLHVDVLFFLVSGKFVAQALLYIDFVI